MVDLTGLFESYNMAVARAYDRIIEDEQEESLKELTFGSDRLSGYVGEQLEIWADTVLSELDGAAPRFFFENIDTPAYAFDVFKIGAITCDQSLPELFLKKLDTYKDIMIVYITGLIRDALKKRCETDDELLLLMTSLSVLGGWKAEEAVDGIIELICEYRGSDVVMEFSKDALVAIGPGAISPVMKALADASSFTEAHEYLLMALASLGRDNRSDELYRFLKNAFLKIGNKIVGASCLADYGDGRAIPALRGYLEKNLQGMEGEVFFEIKSAIEKLGGNTDDIRT